MTPRTAIDLYAGAGGATQGLKAAGFRVLAGVENDHVAAATYRANHPEVELNTDDIQRVNARALRLELGLQPGDLTLLQSCPPCQSWSSLGSGSIDDPRNELVLDVARFIEEFHPRIWILENVPGLRSDARLSRLTRRARSLGYRTRRYLLDAVDFGVPQRRRRLIVVGMDADAGLARLPARLRDYLPHDFDTTVQTAGAALEELSSGGLADDPLGRARTPRSATLRRLKAIPPGGGRFDLPDELRLSCHVTLTRRNATSSYGRIRPNEPAPTLTTRCTTPACGRFVHPIEDRGLTLREAAALQTFPLRYQFLGTYGEIERQIGNALPVRMAMGVALAVTRVYASASGAAGGSPASSSA